MLKIRKIQQADIESIRYLQPEGWSDITFFFRFYTKHNFCHPVAAVEKGRIVGVANATINKDTGWLAHIIVAEDVRGQGIGYKMTEHLIDYLHQKKCRTQLLIATKMGEGLYRKFGFEAVNHYIFFHEKQLTNTGWDKNIRKYIKGDIKKMKALDREISGEERWHVLRHFIQNAHVYADRSDLLGFFLPDFDEGTIIAGTSEAGLALLQFKHVLGMRRTALPEENQSGLDFLGSNGFEYKAKAPRMALGEKLDWRPELIFSRAGGFYG